MDGQAVSRFANALEHEIQTVHSEQNGVHEKVTAAAAGQESQISHMLE